MRRFRLCALTVLAAVFLPGLALAEDAIWSGLVLATNEKPAKPAPKTLAPYVAGMKTVFGYNTFYLLGGKQQKIRRGTEEWIVPTKKVYLKLRCLDRDATAYIVQVDLFLQKKLVVTSKVRLAPGAPLYIRGPSWGKGRLIFLLEVQ